MKLMPTFLIALCIIIFLSGCSINGIDKSSISKEVTNSISNINRNEPEVTYTEALAEQSSVQSSSTTSLIESSGKTNEFKQDFNNIMEIMKMDKDAVIKRLGNGYTIVKAGSEDREEGYQYSKFGITLTFDRNGTSETVGTVYCDETVDIKGAKKGLTFTEIEKILGKGELVGDDDYGYHLSYKSDGILVWFWAEKKNSPTHDLEIRRYTGN